ncbi:MAG: tRNA-dihydrouridine synthase, partial [Planctomycetales bacterium]|nr:tRNA-dihydrouridine synthase [Planctomycetales bacterium]
MAGDCSNFAKTWQSKSEIEATFANRNRDTIVYHHFPHRVLLNPKLWPIMAAMSSVADKSDAAVRVRPLWIGSVCVDPPVLQAPMAGFTNYAFRQIVREFGGAGLQATEMVSARGFAWLDEHEAEHPDRLWGVADEPRPLAVQMWDNDPATLAKVGARLANDLKVSVVDINFGCP